MIGIYKDMSDLDATHISEVVDSLANVFDEDRSGTVGEWGSYLFLQQAKVADRLDINEFMRGFILTTKGDLQSKIDYTFRMYDQNGDNQISGEEIKKMADVRTRSTFSSELSVRFFPSFRPFFECWVPTKAKMILRRKPSCNNF
jgi:hypothetical protein